MTAKIILSPFRSLVVRALKLGFLTEDEIGKELIEQLGPMIGYRQNADLDEK